MPSRSEALAERADIPGGVENIGVRPAWPYTAANALLLLYLLWAAPIVIKGIIAQQGWIAIALAPVCIYLGGRLLRFAPSIRVGRATALAFIVYVLWGVVAAVTPVSDFLTFYRESIDLATRHGLDAALTTKSPTTIAWYGAAFRALGPGHLSMYVAAAVLWAVQIPLLYAALGALGLQDPTAKTAALIYGFSPSVVFYAPLISSESVFNCLLVLCLFLWARSHRQGATWRDAVLGAAVALAFITRMTGAVLLIAFLVAAAARATPHVLSSWRRQLVLLSAFSLVVLTNALMTSRYTDQVSLLPSRWGAYLFMTGTNRASHGGYSEADRVLAGFAGGSPLSHEAASRNALRIGIQRIADDPVGFVGFAFTDKLALFWGSDGFSVDYPTDRSPRRQALEDDGVIAVAFRLADAFWLALNLTAAIALLSHLPWRRGRAAPFPTQLTCVAVLPMLLWSFIHIFVEVQPRYHIPYEPLLSALSAMGLQALRRG